MLAGFLTVVSIVAIALYMRHQPSPERPQEPKPPYPYLSEDVKFTNDSANVTLSGTLTLPKGKGNFPAVVLITGSGPQDRNEEVYGHKIFLVISDYLTRNGIAVLRYDDRGVGQSTGNFKTATSQDFSQDAESAVAYLKTRKEINKDKIGLVGHSEGGIVAPMIAIRSKDIAFMVLLAAPGIEAKKLLLMQDELISRAFGVSEMDIRKVITINGKTYDIVLKSTDLKILKADLIKYAKDRAVVEFPKQLLPPNVTKEQMITAQIESLSSPWFQYIMKYNLTNTLEKVSCPVLALNGEKDLQVPPENLAGIKQAINKGGNQQVTTKELPNLNHFFQECETGSPKEYAVIEQTFSPVALGVMMRWILER